MRPTFVPSDDAMAEDGHARSADDWPNPGVRFRHIGPCGSDLGAGVDQPACAAGRRSVAKTIGRRGARLAPRQRREANTAVGPTWTMTALATGCYKRLWGVRR